MNTTQKTTITVHGHKVSNRSQRRYIAVAVRPEAITTDKGTFVAFARIEKRSDNIETIRKTQRSFGYRTGAFCVVIDTTTGEEI